MRFNTVTKPIPANIYRSMVRWLPIPTVDVVIVTPNRKKTLVGHRRSRPAKNSWYTIGGRLKKHESLSERALRALREEAGLKLLNKQLRLVGVMNEEFADSAWGHMSTHCLNVFYLVILPERVLTPDSQHSKLEWLPLTSKKIHPLAQKKIHQAIATL